MQQVQSDEENDEQPQTNLLLIFGEESELPFYYRRLAGNIPDVKTVKHLLKELDTLGFGKAGFVLDGGFYSEDNINGMYQNHTKFLINVELSAPFVRNNFDKIYDVVRVFSNYDAESETYGFTATTEWNYKQKRTCKGDEAEEKRRIYIHYYYNVEKSAAEERLFNNYLSTLYSELTENRLVEKNKKAYEKFFEVKETPDNGRVVSAKKDEVKHALRYLGYFTLVTNEKMDTFTALHLYKMKDTSEKAFGNIKERLSTGRSAGKSEMSSDGKIFTEFIALTLTSYIDHIMMEGGLYKGYTMREFLDKLDAEE